MSRLIDADAFEKFIKEKYKDGESTDDIKDQMLFDLSYQPTAFDKEKVVEQLLDMRLIRVEQCHGDYEFEVMTESDFDDAIDIEKNGE